MWALVAAERWEPICLAAAGFGVAALAIGLVFGAGTPVGIGVAGIGAAYAVAASSGGDVDGGAVLFAPALLVLAELAYWSLEHRVRVADERSLVARRLAALAIVAMASVGVGTLAVGAAAVPLSAGPPLLVVGVAAAIAVVGLVAALARAER